MNETRIVSSDGTSFLGSLWQMVRHYLWQFLRAKKRTHLLDLNDDCLREIMSFLTDEDLCSVAESSTESSIRLKDIASEAFKRSHKISNSNAMLECKIFDSPRVFRNFGSIILEIVLTFTNLTSLTINCNDQNVIQFIHDLNSLKSLTSLSLRSVSCVPGFLPALAKLTQLRSLELIFCELNDLNPLTYLDNLQKLCIVERNSYGKLDFDIVQLVKRLRNLHLLYASVGKFRLDKQTYLRLVDLVREEARETLLLACAVHKDVADAQNVGFNRNIVRIRELEIELSKRCRCNCRCNKKLKRFWKNFVHSTIDVLVKLI